MPEPVSARELWSALGAAGTLRDLYRRDGSELALQPDRLRDLLRTVDARGPVGETLAVTVQVASALPLVATGARGSEPVAGHLEAALAGERVTALAATDAGAAGSDLTGLTTEVEIGSDRLVVTGHKRWITNATTCDEFLVLARHRPGRHFTSFCWVLVPADAAGVQVEAAGTQLFAGSGLGDVRLDRVELPGDRLVDRPGRALASFAKHITRERLAGALWAVALLRRVLDRTQALLASRTADGRPLWELPTVRERFAGCVVDVRMLDALTRELADRIAGGFDPAAAAMLKAAAARTADSVLGRCAELQGAEGYAPGGVQQLRAEAAVFGIGGGTTDLMLAAVADATDALLADLDR